ncbi:LapA family protein [Shouchella shacheensis]|uniref:LapA family protein n=1 Tax=Shouchella shacheensis TaxID=1649580 RepID=UPI00073FEF9A|nr:lipopolysaccharide assembly protein LapA domain-containing protein [Shouchella shacheensis]
MKAQTAFIIGLIAAIIIAVFAVMNVESVPVNYLFGTANWPLILVILGSVFLGAAVAGALSIMRIRQLQVELKKLRTLDPANDTQATEEKPSPESGKRPSEKDPGQSS